MDLEAAVENAIAWMEQAPLLPALTLLLVASMLEYVVPPVPGDTVILAGGLFAAQGVFPVPATLAFITAGSVIGSVLAWSIGRLAHRSDRLYRLFSRVVRPERLARLEEAYRRKGRWFVLGNRFFPGIRATFLFAAGFARVPLREILVWGSLSALLWNSLLMGIGYVVGLNLQGLVRFVNAYTQVVWVLVVLVLAALVGRALWKRRRRTS